MIAVVALLSGAAAFGAALFALTPAREAWVRSRLAPHLASTNHAPRYSTRVAFEVLGATESRLGSTRLWRRLDALRAKAGVRRTTAELLWASAGAALLVMLLLIIVGAGVAALVLGPAATTAAVVVLLHAKAERRQAAFDEQLPEALESMASALKVGHSLTQSLQVIAEEAEKPIADEFDQLLAEARLGRSLETGLQGVLRRVASTELEFVVTAITVQRRVGGSLAELLESVAATVRRRQQFSRKLRSLTAMGRVSARILIVMPFVVGGMLTVINPSYMQPLYTTRLGQMLLVAAATMLILGSLLLKRIVSMRA